MSVPQLYLIIKLWFLIANAAAFAFFGWDKYCARKGRRRIPETVLLALASLGGSAGALAAMILFNHKTRKLKFNLTVPILLILQLSALVILMMGL